MPAFRLQQSVFAGIAAALIAACSQLPRGATDGGTPLPSAAASAPGSASRATAAGRLTVVQWPNITIDDKALRAAPGARIFNSNNLMMTPNMLTSGARVQYELDGAGQVRMIRVLDGRSDPPSAAGAPNPAAR